MDILNRAFSVLEVVSEHPDGVLLSEISTATALPLATCHRLLAALEEDRLVERMPPSKRYRAGTALIELAATVAAAGSAPMIEYALESLRDVWQECFFLAMVVRDSIVSVNRVTTTDENRITVSVPLGRRMYPHASASGKAILAYLSPARRAEMVAAAGGFVTLTAATVTEPDVFEAELQDILQTGYAVCDQETEVGVVAYAVPVLRKHGDVDTSLAVIGPRDRVTALKDSGLIAQMAEAAQLIASLEAETQSYAAVSP